MLAFVAIPSTSQPFLVTFVRKQKSVNLLMNSLLTDFRVTPEGEVCYLLIMANYPCNCNSLKTNL